MSAHFLSMDLIFSSRVSVCAETLEIELSVVADWDKLLADASRVPEHLVLLSTPGRVTTDSSAFSTVINSGQNGRFGGSSKTALYQAHISAERQRSVSDRSLTFG